MFSNPLIWFVIDLEVEKWSLKPNNLRQSERSVVIRTHPITLASCVLLTVALTDNILICLIRFKSRDYCVIVQETKFYVKLAVKLSKEARNAQKTISKCGKKKNHRRKESYCIERRTFRHRYLQQGHEHHEQSRQWHFWTSRCWNISFGSLQ